MRVGILGTGWSAGRHAQAVRRLPGVELASERGLVSAVCLNHRHLEVAA